MSGLEQAKWIFADAKGEIVDRYFEYQKNFHVEQIADAKLYISAYSQYAVYLNGTFVDCGQYADYEDWKIYDTLVITSYLKEGENELLVQQYVKGIDCATERKQIPAVIFSVVSGNQTLLVSDTTCLARENTSFLPNAEMLTPQIGFNFEYAATAALPKFQPSIEVDKTKELYPRPIKKLVIESVSAGTLVAQGVFLEWNKEAPKAWRCQRAYLSTCSRKELLCGNEQGGTLFEWKIPEEQRGDGAYFIFDMGGECAGLLSFNIEVPHACEVLISYGEHLDDLRVRSAVGPRNFTMRYFAKTGKNQFFYPFQRFGLRYIQVMIFSQAGTINYMGLCHTYYPLTYKPITVTDGLHKEIWKTARDTLELCMHEHYEDCPWREQALYGMDGRIQILCGYYAFDEYEFPKASLRLMAHSLKEDGLLELCPPGKMWVNIPSFTIIFVREVMEYVEHSEDIEFAKEMLPVLTKIVQRLESCIDESGLLPQYKNQWNFYEWTEGLDDLEGLSGIHKKETTYDCLLNAFAADAFRCFARLCEMLDCELKEKYEVLYEKLCEQTDNAFWREEAGGYATYLHDTTPSHELTQSLMIYAGAVPGHKQEKVADIIKGKKLLPCTLSMTIFTYEALMKVSDENGEYVLRDIEAQWTRMLRSNTDTFWETQRGAADFDNAGSLCHGWAAVPIYIFSKYLKK